MLIPEQDTHWICLSSSRVHGTGNLPCLPVRLSVCLTFPGHQWPIGLFQRRNHLLRMSLGFYPGEDSGDLALRSDQKCCALNAHGFLAVHVLLFDHVIQFAYFPVGIAQQGKGQIVFVFELFLLFRGVGGKAQDYRAGLLNLVVCVAEPARFNGSTRGIRLGEKVQDHVSATIILQGDLVAILVGQGELRCSIIDFHEKASSHCNR